MDLTFKDISISVEAHESGAWTGYAQLQISHLNANGFMCISQFSAQELRKIAALCIDTAHACDAARHQMDGVTIQEASTGAQHIESRHVPAIHPDCNSCAHVEEPLTSVPCVSCQEVNLAEGPGATVYRNYQRVVTA